jgi:glycosyltransferase involved in cell wall biosynthesis
MPPSSKNSGTSTLFIPTFNEAEAMRRILPRIDRGWCDQMLVVDAGSRDESVEVARSFGCEVYVQKEKGLRAAFREGFERVRGDLVVTFSPDGNSVPERIPDLLAKLREGYDMVIVSRYLDGAKSEDDDAVSAFGNWMFTRLINLFFGTRYTDALVMFRGYRREIVEKLRMAERVPFMEWAEKVVGTLSGWEPQLSMRCGKARLKTAEIPGDEPRRIAGAAKMRHWRSGAILSAQILYEFLF